MPDFAFALAGQLTRNYAEEREMSNPGPRVPRIPEVFSPP